VQLQSGTMNRRTTALIITLTLLAALNTGCERPPTSVRAKNANTVMGTLAEVTADAYDRETAQKAVEAAYARLEDVNRLMSDYSDESEIGRINNLPPEGRLAVSEETCHCLEAAIRYAELSGGAFDFTCRPLIGLWKQAGHDDLLPTPEALDATRALVGWDKVRLSADTREVSRESPGIQVDLGGIAKGYALDLAADAMRAAGATHGLVNVGGDVRALGAQPTGEPWRIGVRHPFREGDLFCTIELFRGAVATSGVQERFNIIGGARYSHIVDPRTGWPATEAPAVTVIAPTGLAADAWATILSVLTPTEGKALLGEHPEEEIEALWIMGPAERPVVFQTPNFELYVIEWGER